MQANNKEFLKDEEKNSYTKLLKKNVAQYSYLSFRMSD